KRSGHISRRRTRPRWLPCVTRSLHRTARTPSTLSSESTQPCSSPKISAERKTCAPEQTLNDVVQKSASRTSPLISPSPFLDNLRLPTKPELVALNRNEGCGRFPADGVLMSRVFDLSV